MPQDQITEIKKRIRESREKRGLSVRDIAENMGVCIQAVYKWENVGETYPSTLPSVDNIIMYCELLNISTDYLLLGR